MAKKTQQAQAGRDRVRTIRVGDDLWTQWGQLAAARGLSIAALIRQQMGQLTDGAPPPNTASAHGLAPPARVGKALQALANALGVSNAPMVLVLPASLQGEPGESKADSTTARSKADSGQRGNEAPPRDHASGVVRGKHP